jgi:CRISPR-associated protein Cmr2
LPNRFLAIIPNNKNIAENCQKTIEKELEELVRKIWEKVKNFANNSSLIKNYIREHLTNYFQIYWIILPWTKESIYDCDTILSEYENFVGKTEAYKIVKIITDHSFYKPSTVGNAYSLSIELTEKFLGSRKMIRNFQQISEQKGRYKCSLCGEMDEISSGIKDFWEKFRKENPGLIRDREKLCGVCLAKRLLPGIFKKELNVSLEFPSTSEIASVGLKKTLSKEIFEEFKDEFDEFKEILSISNKIEKSKIFPPSRAIPAFKNTIFEEIDGQWLMEESYRKEYLLKEFNLKIDNEDLKVLEGIRNFLKENKISSGKYYSILIMDGDEMGKWLKGEKMPKTEKLIHQNAKTALLAYSSGTDKENLEKLLCSEHPMSPSFHQAFSRKLGFFAIERVRKIVENNHYGKLIYAGGDDIMAFLPIEEVLKCAYEIQSVFKEILSPFASMSAGIVIAHHKEPLSITLNEARDAEKIAKNKFNRNSFCVRFLSRSGGILETGGNWHLIDFIYDLICKFKNDEISTRFPYQFLQRVNQLSNGKFDERNFKILKGELKRIYERKEAEVEFLERLETEFGAYVKSIKEKPFENFANILLIAKFISSEGKYA